MADRWPGSFLNSDRECAEYLHVVPRRPSNASVTPSESRSTTASVASRIRLAESELAEDPGPSLTLVIPMFRESARITSTLEQLNAAGLADIRLVLVDDGSSDDTVAVATKCIARLAIADASGSRYGPRQVCLRGSQSRSRQIDRLG